MARETFEVIALASINVTLALAAGMTHAVYKVTPTRLAGHDDLKTLQCLTPDEPTARHIAAALNATDEDEDLPPWVVRNTL